jgi:hypothetical protein
MVNIHELSSVVMVMSKDNATDQGSVGIVVVEPTGTGLVPIPGSQTKFAVFSGAGESQTAIYTFDPPLAAGSGFAIHMTATIAAGSGARAVVFGVGTPA